MTASGARPSRRSFVLAAGAAVSGLGLGGCAGRSTPRARPRAGVGANRASTRNLAADLQMSCVAAGLENLAVATYQAGMNAADAGRLGTVPPAMTTFFQTAMRQHTDHASAWNSVLTAAGRVKVGQPDPVVKPQIDQAFSQVRDLAGLGRLVLSLENAAAATYLSAMGTIGNAKALQTAAAIHPVEMQHAAVLSYLLGNEPVPATFARTDGAFSPTDCPS
jgi:hypothetical protein